MTEKTGRIGTVPCPVCSAVMELRRAAKKGRLYLVCEVPARGGCGSQWFSRTAAADAAILSRATLDDPDAPPPAAKPAPPPPELRRQMLPIAKPPETPAVKDDPWWNRPLFNR